MMYKYSTCLLLLALSCFSVIIGCDPKEQVVLFKIKAIDHNQQPVEGVEFYYNGFMYEKIDATGEWSDTIKVPVGTTMSFKLVAPETHILDRDIEKTVPIDEYREEPIEIIVTGLFYPAQQDYLFVIEGEIGDSISIDQKKITSLEKSKQAIFLYSGIPNSDFIAQVGNLVNKGQFAAQEEVYLLPIARISQC